MADRGSSNLDAEFEAFEESRQRVRCTTCQLDDDTRAWVEGKVLVEKKPMLAVAEFLQRKGHRIGVGALKGHIVNHVTR